ncbi:unnamed protein product [Lactuca virosa]|uniref:Retrotransposon gag domain-containing protein n=1 Tax=Lactuca virosa TaxID=75947 RepID=A0AAU9NPE9_9ASTR|nr:unnamed protein product [Lactuca virosa]
MLQSVLKPDSTAADIWQTIQDLFHENKETKIIELDDELRHLSIGNQSILEYCSKVKSISDLLTNLGSPVDETNLVIYTINGLSSKYAHIALTIHDTSPFPTFLQMKSKLTLEERIMKKKQSQSLNPLIQDSPSSSTILHNVHQSHPPKP